MFRLSLALLASLVPVVAGAQSVPSPFNSVDDELRKLRWQLEDMERDRRDRENREQRNRALNDVLESGNRERDAWRQQRSLDRLTGEIEDLKRRQNLDRLGLPKLD